MRLPALPGEFTKFIETREVVVNTQDDAGRCTIRKALPRLRPPPSAPSYQALTPLGCGLDTVWMELLLMDVESSKRNLKPIAIQSGSAVVTLEALVESLTSLINRRTS